MFTPLILLATKACLIPEEVLFESWVAYVRQIDALVCTVAAAARQALDVESCLLFVLDSSGEQLWSLSDGGEIVTRTIGVGLVGCCAAYNQVCVPFSLWRIVFSSLTTCLPPKWDYRCKRQASTHCRPTRSLTKVASTSICSHWQTGFPKPK